MWQGRNKVLGTPIPGGSISARQHHTDTAARYRKVSGLHFLHLRAKIAAVAFFRKNDYFYVVKEHKASKMHFDAIVKAPDRWTMFCKRA